MSNDEGRISIKREKNFIASIMIGLAILAIVSYTYKIGSSKSANADPIQTQENQALFIQASETMPVPTPAISDYRTILLLERAADLIVEYIDKVQAGDIDPKDINSRQSYTLAFPVAIQAYNQTVPSPGMEHAWKNVTMVATAYNLVYPLIQQGNPVSSSDLMNLKFSRQWLSNYQDTLEAILARSGKNQDFFTAEQDAVEEMLQENYAGTPLPAPVP